MARTRCHALVDGYLSSKTPLEKKATFAEYRRSHELVRLEEFSPFHSIEVGLSKNLSLRKGNEANTFSTDLFRFLLQLPD